MCLATVTFGVSTHSHPKAAAARRSSGRSVTPVSTHSRAEAAAPCSQMHNVLLMSFNTQPRGGGCVDRTGFRPRDERFNTQPRGGGCPLLRKFGIISILVSTHSRAEAAAWSYLMQFNQRGPVSTHSRAEAAAS